MKCNRDTRRTVVGSLLVFLLAGCGDLVVIHDLGSSGSAHGWHWDDFSLGGHMPLRVLGNPTARNQDQFVSRLAALMSRSVFGNPVAFDPAPGARAPYGQSVVMLFGSEATDFAIDPCKAGKSAAPPAARNPIVAFAAMCIADEPVRIVRGRVGVRDGDTDRALDALVPDVLYALTRRRGFGGGGNDGGGGGGGGGG